MSHKFFLVIAIILNLLILFAYIHKKNLIIELGYKKQRAEKQIDALKKDKEEQQFHK